MRAKGADPSVVGDPLEFLSTGTKRYERLTPDRYEGIVARRVRI